MIIGSMINISFSISDAKENGTLSGPAISADEPAATPTARATFMRMMSHVVAWDGGADLKKKRTTKSINVCLQHYTRRQPQVNFLMVHSQSPPSFCCATLICQTVLNKVSKTSNIVSVLTPVGACFIAYLSSIIRYCFKFYKYKYFIYIYIYL